VGRGAWVGGGLKRKGGRDGKTRKEREGGGGGGTGERRIEVARGRRTEDENMGV